jgi:hypothetical protein
VDVPKDSAHALRTVQPYTWAAMQRNPLVLPNMSAAASDSSSSR